MTGQLTAGHVTTVIAGGGGEPDRHLAIGILLDLHVLLGGLMPLRGHTQRARLPLRHFHGLVVRRLLQLLLGRLIGGDACLLFRFFRMRLELVLLLGARIDTAVGEDVVLGLDLGLGLCNGSCLPLATATALKLGNLGLLLLEGHLVLLVNYRLLYNRIYLFDGGARVVG